MAEERNVDPIAAQLVEIRGDMGIKQNELAAILGMGPTQLSTYENGRVMPKLDVVRDWASVLDHELALVKTEKPTRNRRRASSSTDDVPADLIQVHLSRYQTALAMGMLIGQSGTMRADSPAMAADLQMIADILARSIH